MIAILSLLCLLSLSIIVTRGAPIALARSAFTGVGAAVAVALLVAGCGAPHTPTVRLEEVPEASCPEVDTDVVPDRWVQTAAVARSNACALPRRVDAIRSLAGAGMYANLVLPTLEELMSEQRGILGEEARRSRDALLRTRPVQPRRP